MRFVFLVPGLFLSVCLSMPAVASDVSDLLKKMTTTDDHLNYQGVLVLRKLDNLVAMHVEHGVDDRGVWESMVSLNGEASRVVRVNDKVTSIYPERRLLTVTHSKNKHSLHPALPENLEKLEAYYTINRLKNDRIANHSAVVLDVVPNDGLRYGYRYWLDEQTGVLLRCDLLNEDRRVVEQMMFTMLEYLPSIPASAFAEIDSKGFRERQLDQVTPAQQNPAWQVNNLPTGFMLTQSRVRETSKGEVLHLAYSDGLASVSVFVEPGQFVHKKPEGATSMGALNAYRVSVNQHFVMVMGEVPAAAVKQIAQSVVPVEAVPGE
ncbi:MAG: MucB/RseB C-terminal domain-containing protein [Gammaproteobacteria bacterium]|nr:MucB/RseB C-terminal domain-containing protein [Gammaproteobacteria bacterium]MCW8923384.1 MucB/RseB C-terminal domain-containing protein [Gammaproteobacteria bacterium]